MQLKKLALKDKRLVDKFLALSRPELSVYNFANIYIWRGLFDIRWRIIRDNLCIFFRDTTGVFLYLSPLGEIIKAEAAEGAFRDMDNANRNSAISRIENVQEKDLKFFRGPGYVIRDKFCDYLSLRSELAQLKGDKFKSQRAAYNHFLKHNHFQYLIFRRKDARACLELYAGWAKLRAENNPDPVYRGMIEDSRKSLVVLLNNYKDLGVLARIVKIGDRLRAFTFGFKLNERTFAVLYEITDLSVKGLAQFIFRRLCQELKNYQYINVMDDSGLKNLKKVKLAYRPVRLIQNYIITRSHA